LEVMDRDARQMRGAKPFVFTNLKTAVGVEEVLVFIDRQANLESS
jgi:urease accessory protein